MSPLGGTRLRPDNNIKMYLEKSVQYDVGSIPMDQKRAKWQGRMDNDNEPSGSLQSREVTIYYSISM
jgi:hypothetical protein